MAFQDAGEMVNVDTASLLLLVITNLPIHTDLPDSLISAFSCLMIGLARMFSLELLSVHNFQIT